MRYSKSDIQKMKRAYLKTQSLALAAKICDCSPGTIQRWRDRQGWLTLAKKGKPDAGGSTLTADIAIRLGVGWRQHITDESLCNTVGISYGQLRGWLQRNTPVTIIWTKTRQDASGNEVKERWPETIGLRDLRTREHESLEFDYNQLHDQAIRDALRAGRQGDAMHGMEWRLGVINPSKYRENKGVNVNVAQAVQTNTRMSIDEMKLDIETRRKILAAIRNGKNGNGEKQ